MNKTVVRKRMHYLLVVVMTMQLLLCLVSWIMGIYVDGVKGLLTSQGIRWFVSSTMTNFHSVPFAEIICGLMVFSALRESGLFKFRFRKMSLKQRRAMLTTVVFASSFVCLFLILLLFPHSVLLSALGTLSESPFAKGAYGIVLTFLLMIANVYGYTSGRFVSLHDFVHAHVFIFRNVSSYFILLFLSSLFINSIDYTDMLTFAGNESSLLFLVRLVFYYLPLPLYVFFQKSEE